MLTILKGADYTIELIQNEKILKTVKKRFFIFVDEQFFSWNFCSWWNTPTIIKHLPTAHPVLTLGRKKNNNLSNQIEELLEIVCYCSCCAGNRGGGLHGSSTASARGPFAHGSKCRGSIGGSGARV